jgi:hypothetical protein
MSLAASLLMLAAVAAPQAARPAPPTGAAPATRVHHGVVATALASAVILRPAIVSFSQTDRRAPDQHDAISRQTSHRGRQVLIEFN